MSSTYFGTPPDLVIIDRQGTDICFKIRVKGDSVKAWAAFDHENPVAAAIARGFLRLEQSIQPVPYSGEDPPRVRSARTPQVTTEVGS